MSLRKLFSQNLMRLSRQRKSHAEVARAIGINRQQYNNYLYGKNLPNESIIDRICAYFGVSHASLFQREDQVGRSNQLPADCTAAFLTIACKQASGARKSLRPGWYHIIFRSPEAPYFHVIYAMKVERRNGILEMRRFSRIALEGSIQRFVSFHKGLVIEARQSIFLMSADIFENHSPSLLVARPVLSKVVSYAGKSLVRTATKDEVTRFVIVPVREEASIAGHFKIARYHEPEGYKPSPEITAALDAIA